MSTGSLIRHTNSTPFLTQPWETAKARFLQNLPVEEVQIFEHATAENLFYGASVAQKSYASNSRTWMMQERLASLSDAILDYGKALDVYPNASGLVLSPLWGSLRVILHITSEAGKFQDKMVDLLGSIGDVLPRLRVYEQLFHQHEPLLQAISAAFLDILKICCFVKTFFSEKRKSPIPLSIILKAAWKPFRKQFETYLVEFRKHCKKVERTAGLAHMIEAAQMKELQKANLALQIANARQQRRYQVLSSLPSVDYMSKHSRLSRLRYVGTNSWLPKTTEYMSWRTSTTSDCLCCYGIPGSGKSILAASVKDGLFLDGFTAPSLVIYYYFDQADLESLKPYVVLCSLLKQVLQQLPLERFDQALRVPYDETDSPPFHAVSKFLQSMIKEHQLPYVILDGLDEVEHEDQPLFLNFINDLISKHSNLKCFVTSRTEEVRIKGALKRYKSLTLSIPEVGSDIAVYIQAELDNLGLPHPIAINSRLKRDVLDTLLAGAQGMFLWAKYQLFEIADALTVHEVRHILRNLPKSLRETYARIINRGYNGPNGDTRIRTMARVFTWVAGARRPLKIDELEEAIGLELTDKHFPAHRIAKNAGIRLVDYCSNLVTYDQQTQAVSFAHHTVRQFLFTSTSSDLVVPTVFHFTRSSVNDFIGEICLTYLSYSNFETQVAKLDPTVILPAQSMSLLKWWIFPSTSVIRQVITWITADRKSTQQIHGSEIRLNICGQIRPRDTLIQKFSLLEYVITYWTYHTSELKNSMSSWNQFEDVVFHRQLLFDFRPWLDAKHHALVLSELNKLQDREPLLSFFRTPARAQKVQQSQAIERVKQSISQGDQSMLIYSWAMANGLSSFLSLQSILPRVYEYLWFSGPENIKWNLEFEKLDPPQKFETLLLQAISGTRGLHQGACGFWDGSLLYYALSMQIRTGPAVVEIFELVRVEIERWAKSNGISYTTICHEAMIMAIQEENSEVLEKLALFCIDTLEDLISCLTAIIEENDLRPFVLPILFDRKFSDLLSAEAELEMLFVLEQCLPAIEETLEVQPGAFIDIDSSLKYLLVIIAFACRPNTSLMRKIPGPYTPHDSTFQLLYTGWASTRFGTEETFRKLQRLEGKLIFVGSSTLMTQGTHSYG